jgi:N-acetylglucosamine-6-phosphate deacetylase
MRRAIVTTFAVSLIAVVSVALVVRAQVPSTVPPNGLRENTPTAHAFTNVRIVTAPGKTIDKGTLVIREGVIVAVGADAQVKPPPDAKVWDLKGKTIYPGLIDAYSEIAAEASRTDPALAELLGAKYWNSQVTPQVRGDRIYKPSADENKKYRAQGFVARLAAPSRGVMKGTSSLVTTADDDARKSILKFEVAQHVATTVQRRPRVEGETRSEEERGYPNSPMGAFTLVRQALYDAKWYADAHAAVERDPSLPRPERNDALEALQANFESKIPFVIDAGDELYDLRADQLAREFGLENAIIRGGGQEYRLVDTIAKTGRPIIVPVNFPRPPNVASPEAAMAVSLEDLMDWDLAPENPARLDKAGVKIALSTHGLRDKATFLANVRKAVVRGLNKDSALRAMTIAPAELFGVEKSLGTLEPGKLASFVVTDGDLFAERTKVLETWVEGKRHEITPAPWFDVRGTWKAKLQTGDEPVREATVTIRGELERLNGRVRFEGDLPVTQPATQPTTGPATQPSRETEANSLTLRASRVSFTFKSDLLGRAGVAQLSATVSSEDDGDHWLGAGVWPDGTTFVVTARKTGGAPRRGGDDNGQARLVADAQPATQPAAAVDDQTDAPPTEVEGGTTQVAVPDDEPARMPERRGRRDGSGTTKPVIKDALYAVNFPLGEYGRAKQPDMQNVLLTHLTVWTCGDAGVLKDAYVLIRDGKIAKVGNDDWYKTALVDVPVVDCTGKHLTPGLIDCHSHIATDSGINESGQAITAEVRIGDFVDPNDINIYRQLAGGTTAANILHGSANPIGGQNQVIKFRWGALPEEMKVKDAPPGIKFALGENVKQSNWDIAADRRTRYPQSRMGVDQIIRDEFQAAQDYKRRWDEYNSTKKGVPPRRDLELDAICEILDGRRLIHCHSYRQDEILNLLRICEQFNVRIATLQHILEGYKVADAMAKHGAMGSSFSDWWAYKMEVYDAIPYNGALMHNAGVVVSFNSDDAELARRLNLEAAKAVKYGGLKPEEALKFVTLNPAKQLRIDKWVGSIEQGKDADVVIWNGDPLSVYSRVEQTWVDGRKYFDREEDLKAREQVKQMRTALVQRILTSGESPAEPGENEDRQRPLWPNEDVFCGCNEERRN